MKRILITGKNSYIGTRVENWLLKTPDQYHVDTLDVKDPSWKDFDFSTYDVVFHVAGIAHVSRKKSMKDLYYKVNRDLAIEVAKNSKDSGVKQFIFMSSIIVYGDSKASKRVITKDTIPTPTNFYGDSKLQAENGIRSLESDTFKVVILRPPMIYGPGSKGNYAKLAKLAKITPIFPDYPNERSMLFIDNLCETIEEIIAHNSSGVFFPQDENYLNTSKLVKELRKGQGNAIVLFKFLNPLITLGIDYIPIIKKMFGSLVYDQSINYTSKVRNDFKWTDLSKSKRLLPQTVDISRAKYKICVVHTISNTLDWFVVDSMKFLYQNNFNIHYVANINSDFITENEKYAKYTNVKMSRGVNLINGIKSIFILYKLFKSEKFDIVQYSTPNAAFYASIASSMAKVPVRLYCQWGIRYVGLKGIKKRVFKSIEKITCHLSTWIEPDSKGNLEFSQKEGLYKDNCSVVWNGSACGVNFNKFDINMKLSWRYEYREKYGIDVEDFVFGFIGRIEKDKGINELLEAFIKIENSNTKLIIVGMLDKPKTIRKELFEYSLKSKNILYIGLVKDVQKYLSMMDCLVLPSYREGFGNVVIESEAMGVPVIVTDIPGPREAMIDNTTGILVKKGDSDSLLSAMKKIIYDKSLAERLGHNGYLYAKENFDSVKLFEFILEDRLKLVNGVRNAVC